LEQNIKFIIASYRSQGQTEGAIGQELEKKVSENDNLILEIFHTKKEAYKGLIDIRDVMKCNID